MRLQEQKQQAKRFVEIWKHKQVTERQGYVLFWIDLLQMIFGDKNVTSRIKPEETINLDKHSNYMDVFFPDVRVLIEQKARGIDLGKPAKQSDGSMKTPYEQALSYNNSLKPNEIAYYIITSNFDEIWIYDLNSKRGKVDPIKLKLEDLTERFDYLSFLIHETRTLDELERDITFESGDIIGNLYNKFLEQYEHNYGEITDNILRDLNKLCVRLVFCFYAEDAGIFDERNYFQHYMDLVPLSSYNRELKAIFKIFNVKDNDRDPSDEELNRFPYLNCDLFKGDIKIPTMTKELKALIHDASITDWSKINPSIFGALFESTLNTEERRDGGMHYTSTDNIRKIVEPLFFNDLETEFEKIKKISNHNNRIKELMKFQTKISNLKFLDPACGSGNFLTYTYKRLRELENKVIIEANPSIKDGQKILASKVLNTIKVSIDNFYGIEINDFACDVAYVALYIAEAQMKNKTVEEIGYIDELALTPIRTEAHIHCANACSIDWNEVCPKSKMSYVIGNPPFHGGMYMNKRQKAEIKKIFDKVNGNGEMDYVCGWYKLSAEYIKDTDIRCAFVSTNSICQGSSVITFWKHLIQTYNTQIDFAYTSFIWNSEAKDSAKVHCVIVGFSDKGIAEKYIYHNDGNFEKCSHINPYLTANADFFIETRDKPLCKEALPIHIGSMPRGNFKITPNERKAIINKYPYTEKWIRPYIGSEEFLNNKERYCLWMVGANPTEVLKCKPIIKKLEAVRKSREESPAEETRKLAEADKYMYFAQIADSKEDYIIIPKSTSGKREYLPIGFMKKEVIGSDLVFLMPKGGLYEFGILMSKLHNIWIKMVAGRLKSDPRYSKDIVYNNFPWCKPTKKQKKKIEETAKAILEVREKHSDTTLANMYSNLSSFGDLLKAHENNNKAVLEAYGIKKDANENYCFNYLLKLYGEYTKQ
ncbi:MAG: N-6 DNA methylase [Candidatus Riflebacteria bacterium]|nr:N-6 DNA methylase [Candidatus Riflebacteria bacterium]